MFLNLNIQHQKELQELNWDKKNKNPERCQKEEEARERSGIISLEAQKEKTWDLYKECKIFLDQNENNWEIIKGTRQ